MALFQAVSNPVKVQAYSEEGRLTALELMGHLVSYYRNLAAKLNDLLDFSGSSSQQNRDI